jgi:hypothetical protein
MSGHSNICMLFGNVHCKNANFIRPSWRILSKHWWHANWYFSLYFILSLHESRLFFNLFFCLVTLFLSNLLKSHCAVSMLLYSLVAKVSLPKHKIELAVRWACAVRTFLLIWLLELLSLLHLAIIVSCVIISCQRICATPSFVTNTRISVLSLPLLSDIKRQEGENKTLRVLFGWTSSFVNNEAPLCLSKQPWDLYYY